MQNVLRVLSNLILFCFLALHIQAQSCEWLQLNATPGYAVSSEIDIPGDKITVEAKFIRTTPYSGGQIWAGDLVSKHKDPTDANYLLRPNNAEITTTTGYHRTPDVCEIELNKIYHVALVYDGASLKFYRNGFLLSEVAATGNLVQNNWRTFIGYYDAQIHPENFIGYIDEVRIWNYARSQNQIRSNMSASLPSPATQAGLVAYYTFDNLVNKQGNSAFDLSLSPTNAAVNVNTPDCKFIADSCGIDVTLSDTIVISDNDTICLGSKYQIQTLPAEAYIWTPALYLDDPTSPGPVASPPVSITYYVDAYNASTNTTIRDSVHITVIPLPNTTVSGDTTICGSGAVQLNATGGVSYKWFPASQMNDATSADPIVAVNNSTMYTVDVTGSNGCIKTDTVNVVVRPYPDFKASGDRTVCEGDQVVLSASGGTSYQWSPVSQVADPSAATTNVSLSGAANSFSVRISEDVCNYDTTINMTIVSVPPPVISVVKSNDINCTTPTAQLQASGADGYFWTPFVYLDNANSATPIVSPDTTTTFSVTGFTNAGCSASASITVKVDGSGVPRFVLPNAFTPNGDGRNDCFGINRWGSVKIDRFSIYNRWGQIVFQTNNPAECWDGKVSGILQDSGGYVYIINASSFCGPIKRTGMVTLIR